jgi:hypothetical protein
MRERAFAKADLERERLARAGTAPGRSLLGRLFRAFR